MSKSLRDCQPTSKDLQVAYKVCERCRDKVMILEAGTECPRINCADCGVENVARYKDYFTSQR